MLGNGVVFVCILCFCYDGCSVEKVVLLDVLFGLTSSPLMAVGLIPRVSGCSRSDEEESTS